MDIEDLINRLIEGHSYRKISKDIGVPVTTIHDFLNKPEHSARTRDALLLSAESYVDKAEETLIEAESDPVEISRAKELSQFYKWKASKRSPKKYGDKLDIDHTTQGEKLIFTPLNLDVKE